MGALPTSMTQTIRDKFVVLKPLLDERTRRLWAALEARAGGRGGITRVAEATGLSQSTIRAGLRELDASSTPDDEKKTRTRLRRQGAGRKPLMEHDPRLLEALEALVDPVTRGDPMGPLRWTCKSATRLATDLQGQGHAVSERTVNRLLHALGYSLQTNRKTLEGRQHPDRDTQFQLLTSASRPSRGKDNRWYRWIPRKRNWWVRSATGVGSGVLKGNPKP